MSGNVSTLVIRVNGHVQPHQLDKRLVVSVSQHGSKVGRPILVSVDRGDLAVPVDVLEDSSSDDGELGEEVHRVFVSRLPVFLLGGSLGVSLGKGRVVVELRGRRASERAIRSQSESSTTTPPTPTHSSNSQRELRHRVQSVRTPINQLFHKLGQSRPRRPFSRQPLDLFLRGDFARDQQPEQGFRERLGSTGSGREGGLTFGDGHSSESNTLFGIEDGTFPDHSLRRREGGTEDDNGVSL